MMAQNPATSPLAPDAAALRRRARILKAVNVPMRAVLGLPVPTPLGRNLMLLYYTGRKTGKAYRQPVSYARESDQTLLTPGGGRWTLNMTDGRPVQIRLRGRDRMGRPELITDPEEVQRAFAVIVGENPRAARFIPIPRDADGRLEESTLGLAISHGFCIVRWHLK